MSRRSFLKPRDRAAERRGILALAASRAIAEAERHRDRAHDKLDAITRQVAVDRAMGLDMSEAVAGIAELREALSAAEHRLDGVRGLLT